MLKEIVLKFLKNREAKNAGWIITSKVLQMLLSFAVSVFTARFLGPSNYGLINYAGAYISFFMACCTLGINSIIVKEFISNPKEQGEAIGTTITLRLISSVLSSMIIVGVVAIVDANETETLVVTGLCSLQLLFNVFDTFDYWFQYQYKSKSTSIAAFLAVFATSIYKIVLLLLKKNIYWFAVATTVDYIVLGAVLYVFYKYNKGPKLSFSLKKAKSLLKNSYHYILSGMMIAIYGQTDKLMLKQMLDETAVGYYSLATSINSMWTFVLSAIIVSMAPTIISLYKTDRAAFERKNRQLYSIVIYVSVIVALLFMTLGGIVIKFVYGEEYLPATVPLSIVCWYTIFSYLGVAREPWIVCENKQKYLKYLYLSAAILNVVLNFILIPVWGVAGAAVASLITQIGTGILLPCCFSALRPNVKLMVEAIFFGKIHLPKMNRLGANDVCNKEKETERVELSQVLDETKEDNITSDD